MLTAAWIVGVITALAGGRPAMICGATGAIAAVVGDLVYVNGIEYLFWAVIVMGALQLALGVLRADKLVRLIPHPVMIGFCNGLAIVIGLAQFSLFKRADHGGDDDDAHRRLSGGAFGAFEGGGWIGGTEALCSAVLTLVSFATCLLLPRLTKRVPSSLVAIVLATTLEWAVVRPLGARTQVVSDFASVRGTLPVPVWFDDEYSMPPLNSKTLETVLPVSTVMALVGVLESLMTLTLVDELTQTKGNPNREVFGQGLANVVCGMLGGMGGCAMIGQAMINVQSGATTRISSVVAGLFLLFVLLAAYPAINAIPVTALAGVMFNVVVHTFEWPSLRIMFFSSLPSSLRDRFGARSEYKARTRRDCARARSKNIV